MTNSTKSSLGIQIYSNRKWFFGFILANTIVVATGVMFLAYFIDALTVVEALVLSVTIICWAMVLTLLEIRSRSSSIRRFYLGSWIASVGIFFPMLFFWAAGPRRAISEPGSFISILGYAFIFGILGVLWSWFFVAFRRKWIEHQ